MTYIIVYQYYDGSTFQGGALPEGASNASLRAAQTAWIGNPIANARPAYRIRIKA